MNNFPKSEKLCGDILVSSLFEEGKAFIVYPLRIVYKFRENTNDSRSRVLVVVPKKKIRKANKRNLLKRRIREAYRTQKTDFIKILEEKDLYLHLAFTYVADVEFDFNTISTKTATALSKILVKTEK